MTQNSTEQSRTHQGVASYDQAVIDRARRLAADDGTLRILLSEVWWAALRVGLALGPDRPLTLPSDPFQWSALVDDGLAESPF